MHLFLDMESRASICSMPRNRFPKGEEHPNWKGGKFCVSCGVEKRTYKGSNCMRCRNLHRWRQPGFKERVAKTISESRITLGSAVGARNPKWKGGVTPVRLTVRKSRKYKGWRKSAFVRDNYTCRICNKRGGDLEVDYIKPFKEIFEENNIVSYRQGVECEALWDLHNAQTLCKPCHARKTFGS